MNGALDSDRNDLRSRTIPLEKLQDSPSAQEPAEVEIVPRSADLVPPDPPEEAEETMVPAEKCFHTESFTAEITRVGTYTTVPTAASPLDAPKTVRDARAVAQFAGLPGVIYASLQKPLAAPRQ